VEFGITYHPVIWNAKEARFHAGAVPLALLLDIQMHRSFTLE
jgi:hypothetical protein